MGILRHLQVVYNRFLLWPHVSGILTCQVVSVLTRSWFQPWRIQTQSWCGIRVVRMKCGCQESTCIQSDMIGSYALVQVSTSILHGKIINIDIQCIQGKCYFIIRWWNNKYIQCIQGKSYFIIRWLSNKHIQGKCYFIIRWWIINISTVYSGNMLLHY